MKQFYKIWFTGRDGRTAGLVFDTVNWPIGKVSIAGYSRFFPPSEFRKMSRLHIGPVRPTFQEAFHDEASEISQSTRNLSTKPHV